MYKIIGPFPPNDGLRSSDQKKKKENKDWVFIFKKNI